LKILILLALKGEPNGDAGYEAVCPACGKTCVIQSGRLRARCRHLFSYNAETPVPIFYFRGR